MTHPIDAEEMEKWRYNQMIKDRERIKRLQDDNRERESMATRSDFGDLTPEQLQELVYEHESYQAYREGAQEEHRRLLAYLTYLDDLSYLGQIGSYGVLSTFKSVIIGPGNSLFIDSNDILYKE